MNIELRARRVFMIGSLVAFTVFVPIQDACSRIRPRAPGSGSGHDHRTGRRATVVLEVLSGRSAGGATSSG
jgi:hypothetical protein